MQSRAVIIALAMLSTVAVPFFADVGFVDVVEATHPKPDDCAGSCGTQEFTGDYIVCAGHAVGCSEESYTDEIIIMNGNITIPPGKTLKLSNTILLMNSTYNGQYHISVSEGGFLGKLIAEAGSHITSNVPGEDNRYQIWVDRGGNIEITNSKVSWVGFNSSSSDDPDRKAQGIHIEGPNAIIIVVRTTSTS